MRKQYITSLLLFLGIFYSAFSATISGHVYEDVNPDTDLNDNKPLENVTVKLFDSNGNILSTTTTDSNGLYSFSVSDGDYYVIVDSKTVPPSLGFRSGYNIGDVWAEETYISAPSNDPSYSKGLCDDDADPTTPPVLLSGTSKCFGGAYGNRSDDASNLDTAEHKVFVHIENGKDLYDIDFRFSFNIVTNVNDQDDDPNNNRTCQGCLRQFIQNANAVSGGNTMKFIPVVPPNAGNGKWWEIILQLKHDANNNYALPPVEDQSTIIDGTAYSYQSPSSIRDENPGTAGHGGEKVGVGPDGLENTGDEEVLPIFYNPELEIDINQLGHGIVIKTGSISVKNIAINNCGDDLPDMALIRVENGSNIRIENCYIGTKADGTGDKNTISILGINTLYGTGTNIVANYISNIHNTGVQMEGEGVVEYNDIYFIGSKNSCGDGVSTEFLHNNSGIRDKNNLIVRYNRIEYTAAYGIETWGFPGALTASNNTILKTGQGDENGNLCGASDTGYETGGIRIFGVGSEVRENLIYDVPGNGVVVVSTGDSTKQNLITKNVFYNTGGISIDLDQTHHSGNPNGDGVSANNGSIDSNKINEDMDYPVFTIAELNNNTLHVAGYVGTADSKISGTHTIEIYKADDDGNNNGEVELGDGKSVPHGDGRYYLGSCQTNSDGTFDCNITVPTNVSLKSQDLITGIAIDSNNNTSEFGAVTNVISFDVSGHVYEDTNGDGDLSDRKPIPNVTVRLYKEDGTFVASTTTNTNGEFSFSISESGNYYVVVDSKSISPSAGFNGESSMDDVWAEQTYAPKGGYCDTDADPNTQPEELSQAGYCFGGAYGNKSDGFSNGAGNYDITKAEHYAKIIVNNNPVTDLDFGFSFNVVTNLNDQDDDPDSNRTCQGCLRQFIQNANAIPGSNTMRFVPVVDPDNDYFLLEANHTMTDTDPFNTSEDYPVFWIKDTETTIDGTVYSYRDGSVDTKSFTEPGLTVGYIRTCNIQMFQKPRLIIHTSLRNKNDQTEPDIWNPYLGGVNYGASIFYVDKNNFTLKNISAYGGHYAVYINGATDFLVEDNFLGVPSSTLADPGYDSGANKSYRSNRGIIVSYPSKNNARGVIRHNYIAYTRLHGIFIYNINGGGTDTGLLVEKNVIKHPSKGWEHENGITAEGNSEGIVIRCNYVADSCAVGIETYYSDGGHIIKGNTVERTGLSSCAENPGNHEKIGIRLASPNNVVMYNLVRDSEGAGILVLDSKNGNKISQNSIYNNKGIAIDLLETGGDKNVGDGVTPNNGLYDNDNVGNRGLDYPVFTKAALKASTLHIEGYIGTSSSKLKPPSGKTWQIEIYKAYDDGNNNGEIEAGDGKDVSHGEGKDYIVTVNLTDADFDNDGNFSKDITISGLSVGDLITAITIDDQNNTSEFSANVEVISQNEIYGYVYHDGYNPETQEYSKPNKNKDSYEKWTDKDNQAPTIYVKLCDTNNNVLQVKEIQDGSGYYQFKNLNDGTYVVIEDTDRDTGNCESSDPEGWISTTKNKATVQLNGNSVEVNFGDFHGSAIRGYVFTDNGGSNQSNANNGKMEEGEEGIKDVTVKACLDKQCSNVIDESITNGEGIYELFIPVEYNGQNLYIVEFDKPGYISTGNTRGNMTVYKNYADPLEDRNIIDYNDNTTGNISENYNFGDVRKINIQPPQSYSVPVGSSVSIEHTITVNTPGKVAIKLASQEAWPYIVFEDTNCDGNPDGDPISKDDNGYYKLNNGNTIDPGTDICIVIKTVIPTDLQQQTVEKLTVIAYEDWLNTNSSTYDDNEDVTDTITVSKQIESMLSLEKFVKNITQNGDYTKRNEGKPCDILEYKIVFKNIGSQNLKGLSINDNIPAGTEFVEDQYTGKDVYIDYMGTQYTGDINDTPDTDGVELSDNALKVNINTVTGKTHIEPGEEGYILYRVRIKGENCQ